MSSHDNFKCIPASSGRGVRVARLALISALWCLLLLPASVAHAVDSIIVDSIEPIAPPEGPLGGGLDDVMLVPNANGSSYELKGRLTIYNGGDTTAKEVNATVAVIDVARFSRQPILMLFVANFRNGRGDVKPGRRVTIPLRRKFSKRSAVALAGHSLVIFIYAEGENVPNIPIMYGPVPKI